MGKKLKVLNVVLPVVCAVTLVAAPMTVWGIEASFAANNFDVTCIGNVNLSNRHVKLHHDFHTVITPKNEDEEIETQTYGKPLIILVGGKELNENQFSYTWNDGALELNVLGEYITKTTLIIYTNTTKKATLELWSSAEQSTPIAENAITYEFAFVGAIPVDNKIQVSVIIKSRDKENMNLGPTGTARVNVDRVDVDLSFRNETTPETLESCTIEFYLFLQFTSGNTGQLQSHSFSDLKAKLIES